jgi:hypothetical protein
LVAIHYRDDTDCSNQANAAATRVGTLHTEEATAQHGRIRGMVLEEHPYVDGRDER